MPGQWQYTMRILVDNDYGKTLLTVSQGATCIPPGTIAHGDSGGAMNGGSTQGGREEVGKATGGRIYLGLNKK